MWTYSQSNGSVSHNGKLLPFKGYSGRDAGLDNPDMESAMNLGPIPRGTYHIGRMHNSTKTGHDIMSLTPIGIGKNTYGRSGFEIHGDNRLRNKSASEGCIILPPQARKLIADSNDHILIVVR